ncbi:MAG TPA: histidine phosphatase family protein [Casimicrobiaceae bacterium]|nr:histidine phosphatase family protein [Casimicrobiaceae bacterium]
MSDRRHFLRFASRYALALLGALAFPIHAQDAQNALAGKALLDALLRGGYVIYFRHADTDFSANDDNMTSFEDCAKQRNLTDVGRMHAREIGKAIAELKIPVGDVIASPYCRTRETARLIFGRERVSNDVRGGPAGDRARYAALEKLLAQPVSAGVNRVIVSHGNPFAAVAGTPYLREGEAAIVEPLDAKGFRVVARVTWDAWGSLAR